MARITCDFFSEALQCSTSMTVLLPQPNSHIGVTSKVKQKKHPTLYLLHGLSDDHTIWTRFTSIERYASSLGWAIVMPAAGRSFYTNMEHGYDFYTYVSEEVPQLAQSFFPLSEKREENFIAGLSMGGYGAFKVALRNPEKFAAAASMSGSLDINERMPAFPRDFKHIFGDRPIVGSEDDLYHLATNIKAPSPMLYQCCGTEDHNYEANVRFRDYALQAGLSLTFEDGPGGHDWGYWDKQIGNVLAFFENQL
ncbi:S-formylglutathione hydrolase FrmB [Bacillus sp. THAF10]|uniref:alpha/beta hydrolase n=1 Tax=Bacillus sp. THAF10 TaxID=2587848 RepID=UPI00126979D6|nr:alpha/beta hydrolase family protein [Bacillus sp. THAF10]QFT90541.1 S-formylglutathione hydrolase FrmB [Bacillus sp. THAF10]